jgi:E3 ubiquitin-protein ligase Topors
MGHIWPLFCALHSNVIAYCSNHPEEVHRLIPWLNRELQAILLGPGLTARVLDIVITQLSRCHMQSAEFRSHLESYLRNHYDHFIHEFYTFARSSYDMFGFDQNASYYERNNYEVRVSFIMSQQ